MTWNKNLFVGLGLAIVALLTPGAAAQTNELPDPTHSDCYEVDWGLSDAGKETFVYKDTKGDENIILVVINEDVKLWVSITIWEDCLA